MDELDPHQLTIMESRSRNCRPDFRDTGRDQSVAGMIRSMRVVRSVEASIEGSEVMRERSRLAQDGSIPVSSKRYRTEVAR